MATYSVPMREKHFFFFPQTIDKTATKLIDDKHYDSEKIAAIRDEVCASACLCTRARENVGALLTMVGSRSQASLFYFSDREFVYVFLQLLVRRDNLRKRAAIRRGLLEDSFLLQQLYQDSDDLKNWINKKKKLADDEDYKVGRVADPEHTHWYLI